MTKARRTVTVIAARGVSEQYGSNMLSEVTKRLDKAWFDVKELQYSAGYAPVGESFGVSQEVGRRNLLHMIDADPNPVVLLGFSAGAQVVGDVAQEIALGMHPKLEVLGVGLLADPSRAQGQIEGPDRGGYGIKGSRPIPTNAFPVWSFSAPGDPISELPVGNPLRSFADWSEWFGSPDHVRRLADRARANQWQRWWSPANVRTWGGAMVWLNNYLTGGRHIAYARERMQGSTLTYTEALAERVSAVRAYRNVV